MLHLLNEYFVLNNKTIVVPTNELICGKFRIFNIVYIRRWFAP